jgi:hypothetical protein
LKRLVAEDLQRSRRFGKIADRLVQTVIRPRVARLSAYFANAEPLPADAVGRYQCVCRFRHTAQFPASTTLTLAVSHDARFGQLVMLYELEILPIPFRFEGQSQLPFRLDAVDEGLVAGWVEERIVSFVDTYLRLSGDDRGREPSVSPDGRAGLCRTMPCVAAPADREGRAQDNGYTGEVP